MSILTKICVVVLLALVLLACPVFVNMATVPFNYRSLYQGEKLRNKVVAVQAAVNELARSRAVDEAKAADLRAQSVQASLDQQTAKLKADLAVAVADKQDMQGHLYGIQARLDRVNVLLKKYQDRQVALQAQLDEARVEKAKKLQENRKLTQQLREAQGQIEKFEHIARLRAEQIAERDEKIQELESQLAAVGKTGVGEAPEVVAADVDITGTVTIVQDDLASINVGSANGVEAGMKLIIYRGDRFVGYLRVSEVTVRRAAGVIVDRQLDPVAGDKVTSRVKGD